MSYGYVGVAIETYIFMETDREMSRIPYEDAFEEPEWLGFNFIFKDTQQFRLKKKIEKFEKLHPNLTFVWGKDITKDMNVMSGPILLADGSHTYRELKYSFKMYGLHAYYQPSEGLLSWLNMIYEWLEYKKEKEEVESKNES